MNSRFTYDLEKRIFVNDEGVKINNMTPEIAYGTKPVWEWRFINSEGEPWDFSGVAAWKAVVDNDYTHQTPPMCRTLGGIAVEDGVVKVPLDALTTTFRDKTDGKRLTRGYFDLSGYDADGVKVFYFSCDAACLYVLDPEEGFDPLEPPSNYVSPAQVEAIAQGVVDAALDAYTPPPGQPGETGPAPSFEFSATGAGDAWHADWAPGDLYLRVSTDGGETWQGPIPLAAEHAEFPLVAAWSEELTYATGALVAFGAPAGLYQARMPVGYDQSPAEYPGMWRQIAGPGRDGASSAWHVGTGAPARGLGNDNDQYLDELYNHYRKADGAWVQVGSIKGVDGAGINSRGAWAEDALYSAGDGVTCDGSVWRCKVPHTGKRPPESPEGASLYWELFVARGSAGRQGPAGSLQIAAINMLGPMADPYASENPTSTPERRVYTLNIPRGSTGPAGTLRITMGRPLEAGEEPTLEELPGSAPYQRLYELRMPLGERGERGEPGAGMVFNAAGDFADRVQYDGAAAGYAYLATELLTDDRGGYYQAMYVKRTDAHADWTDAIRLYLGKKGDKGDPGKDGRKGDKGDRGENAAVKPDLEFTADDLYENTLIIEGTDPVAQVEVFDVSGHGHAVSIGNGDGAIAITTRRDTGHTLVAFDQALDLTYGGRVRFAQGLSGQSLYQMWLAAGHAGSQADYILWLRETATRINVTDDDLLDVGGGVMGVAVPVNGGVIVAVLDEAGTQYLLQDGEASYAGEECTVRLQRILDARGIGGVVGTWQLILAGGKGEKGDKGDQPELGDEPAAELGASAAAGVSNVAARADHVHPTAGLATAAQLGNYLPITSRGAANGVASLDAAGKVPATQLPASGGGPDLSDASPAALAATAAPGEDTNAARADHVHPTTGLVTTEMVGASNGVASLIGGKVPLSQLPTSADVNMQAVRRQILIFG